MSWIYVPELAGSVSRSSILSGDSEPSVTSNTTDTASRSYNNECATESSTTHQSGPTLKPSTVSSGSEWLTLLRRDSLASRSASQENKKVRPTSETYGPKLSGSFAKYDRAACSWRTYQRCLLADTLAEFSGTWPKAGMIVDGAAYPLPALEHRTNVIGSGLLPTPTANGSKRATTNGKNISHKTGQRFGLSLAQYVRMWPTPRANSAMAATITEESVWKASRFPNLETVVGRSMWPTPKARDFKDCGENTDYTKVKGLAGRVHLWPTPQARDHFGPSGNSVKGLTIDLPMAVRIWPTPQASDHRDRGCMLDASIQRRMRIGKQVGLTAAVKETRQSGSLNPTWVGLLMGYPLNWTNLAPMGLCSFREWNGNFSGSVGWDDGVDRVATGIPKRVGRLKALGNSVVPAVVARAWEELNE